MPAGCFGIRNSDLECNGRNPGTESVPHFSDFTHHRVTKLEEGSMEESVESSKSGLVEELRYSQESVEESVDGRDGLRQLRPEGVGDDVQDNRDDETAKDGVTETVRQLVKPSQNGGFHLRELLLGQSHMASRLGFDRIHGLADGVCTVLQDFLVVYCICSSLSDCASVVEVLSVFHINSPLNKKCLFAIYGTRLS